MKRAVTRVVALLAGACAAHSQGTISFGNYATGVGPGNYIYVSLGHVMLGGNSGPSTGTWYHDYADGNDWTVELYGAAGANQPVSSLVPVLDAGTELPLQAQLADGSADAMTGTWYSPEYGSISGAYNGQWATVEVVAWYNKGTQLTSLAAAEAAGVPVGFSFPANVILGGPYAGNSMLPGPPTSLPVFPSDFGDLEIDIMTGTVPEPNTVVLAVIGAAGFFLRVRRRA